MSPMSPQRGADREAARRRFVADPDVLGALGLTFEHLSDRDVRSVVIRHEHPEFEQALKEGRREIEGVDGSMNLRLHLAMHEIVAAQLWDDSPPEVWDTAARLWDAGYERHEILHMLGRLVSDQVWEARHDERPTIASVTSPRYGRFRALGSASARPRRRSGATTTPARRLVGQRERQGSVIDGLSAKIRRDTQRSRGLIPSTAGAGHYVVERRHHIRRRAPTATQHVRGSR